MLIKNKFNTLFYLIFLLLLFYSLTGCIINQIEKTKNSNTNITSFNMLQTNDDFPIPSSIFLPDLNIINDNIEQTDESDFYLKIVFSMPSKVPDWFTDKLLWLDLKDEMRINIIFEREDETLAAAKRFAENEIRTQIDKNLKKLLEIEIMEFFDNLESDNENLIKYIKFQINDFNFTVNQFNKDSYWQYLLMYNDGETRYFYRYYIYIDLSYRIYSELRDLFIQKIYGKRITDRYVIELLIEFLKNKK